MNYQDVIINQAFSCFFLLIGAFSDGTNFARRCDTSGHSSTIFTIFFWVAKRPSSGFNSERTTVTATIDRMGDYVGGKPQIVVLLLQTEC